MAFKKKTFNQLEVGIVQWADEKGIFENSDAGRQMDKMFEEVEELSDEVDKSFDFTNGNREAIRNELGDVLVTCIVQSRFHGLNLTDCLEAAFNKITKRTGRMSGGVFVKDTN